MRYKWDLRTFFAGVVILGIATCLLWDYVIRDRVEVSHCVLGPITAGSNSVDAPLTLDELRWVVARQKNETGAKDSISNVNSASIVEFEKSVEPARNVPLIGMAELHKTVYRCNVEALSEKGKLVRRTLYVVKSHFHMLEID